LSLRVGILAAEPSGDLLGAGLMRGLRALRPDTSFEGVGGPRMAALGLESRAPMERLSVMGLVEVLRHLPELMRIRRRLLSDWLGDPPDVFVGVDAPDFNLKLEQHLRAAGVPTVHYVSPTVWAWRPQRVVQLRRSADLVLSIFPFEREFLDRHRVRNRYVGHPLAHELDLQPDRAAARAALGLDVDAPVLALLPGSRTGEVGVLAPSFLETAVEVARQREGLQVVAPLVNDATRELFEQIHRASAPRLPVVIARNNARQALAAADVVLTASGTATLEALLSKRPMVVGYRVNAATYWLARSLRLVKVDHIAMANLLADERLAPEFVQYDCRTDRLAPAVLEFFRDPARVAAIERRYLEIHRAMRMDTNAEAARAVLDLLAEAETA
jgi:lipid-A-disaccharide synthase